VPRVEERVTVWLDPWPHAHTTGYQIVQSLFSIANGGFAGKGFGKGVFATTNGHDLIPYLPTDFIYSALAQELGLVGAAALLLVYMLFCLRGFRIAMLAQDGFSKLLAVGLVLLASLIVGTTYWQAWAASGLADRQDNAIQRVAEFSVKRGKIVAADDRTILADNYTRKVGNQKLYFRKYPQRGLAAHIVGYSTQVRSRAGLEESENDFLTGSNTNLSTVVDTTLSKLKGETIKGNDLHLTIQPKAQRVALNALGGKCGAAVALDTKTGAMLVSVSSPTYDPNLVESHFKL